MLSNTLQFFLLLVFYLSVSITAQDLSGLPPCATSCLATALSSNGKTCTPTDFACLCKNPSFIASSNDCYKNSCTSSELLTAQKWGADTCLAVGVQIATNGVSNVASGVANAANGVANAANATANGLKNNNSTSPAAATPTTGNAASTNAKSAAVTLSVAPTKVLAIPFALVSLSLMI